jgi:hypothetical protein
MSVTPRTTKVIGLVAALLAGLIPPGFAQEPRSRGDTLEITSQRIDQLLDGLKAERPLREQIAKKTGAVGQHQGPLSQADIAKIQECGKAEMQRYQAQAKANQEGMDPKQVEQMDRDAKKNAEEQAKKTNKRMQELAMSGDAAALKRYQDSLHQSFIQRAAQRQAERQGPECGTLEASANPAQLAEIDGAGAKASGLPLPQYVLLRRRVATYFRAGGVDGQDVSYSENEKKTFEKRGRDLMPYAMMLGTSPR